MTRGGARWYNIGVATERTEKGGREWTMVKKGDLLEKSVDGRSYADVFECVCADDEVFVVGRAKFQRVQGEDYIGYEVCGVSYENLRAFPNTDESVEKNGFTILEHAE